MKLNNEVLREEVKNYIATQSRQADNIGEYLDNLTAAIDRHRVDGYDGAVQDLVAWCTFDELPEFLAPLLYVHDVDIRDIVNELKDQWDQACEQAKEWDDEKNQSYKELV